MKISADMSLPNLAECMGIVPVTAWSAASPANIRDARLMRSLLVISYDGRHSSNVSSANWLQLLRIVSSARPNPAIANESEDC